MNSSKIYLTSSIGRKLIVAVTGLMMSGFLVAHLAGNLLAFAGADAINAYAAGLAAFPLLNLARAGILAATLAHIFFAIKLNLENRAARPEPYAYKKYVRATFGSRHMVLSGLLVLFYILFHLAHFTFRITNPEVAALEHAQVYEMMMIEFTNPAIVLLYCAALTVLGLHISHGLSSMFQTLGLSNKKYAPIVQKIGPIVGWLLALSFMSIPLSIMFGFIN